MRPPARALRLHPSLVSDRAKANGCSGGGGSARRVGCDVGRDVGDDTGSGAGEGTGSVAHESACVQVSANKSAVKGTR